MRSYLIDPSDQILSVTGDWDAFAVANRGAGAMAARIVGHSLWAFVHGIETRAYLEGLFHECRSAGVVQRTTYRCDSPQQERLFQMEIVPGPCGRIEVIHHLLRQRPLAIVPLRDAPGPAQFWRCSQCKSCSPGRHWFDHRHFCPPRRAVQIDVVCPACRTMASLSAAQGSADCPQPA